MLRKTHIYEDIYSREAEVVDECQKVDSKGRSSWNRCNFAGHLHHIVEPNSHFTIYLLLNITQIKTPIKGVIFRKDISAILCTARLITWVTIRKDITAILCTARLITWVIIRTIAIIIRRIICRLIWSCNNKRELTNDISLTCIDFVVPFGYSVKISKRYILRVDI